MFELRFNIADLLLDDLTSTQLSVRESRSNMYLVTGRYEHL
jgi:hypothetical protein